MNLNKYEKEAFVRAAMLDIPRIDYLEIFKKMVVADVISQLPESVRLVYENPETRGFIRCRSVYIRQANCLGGVHTVEIEGYEPKKEVLQEIKSIHDKFELQEQQRRDAEIMLTNAISPFKTLKRAKEALPEFVKYLPEEGNKTSNLPVTTNLKESLSALGWVSQAA